MTAIVLHSLASHRHAAGLSQRQLAKDAGVNYQRIRRLEAGGNAGDTPLRVLADISNALNVPMVHLLDGIEPAPASPPAIDRLTLAEARLLRKFATKPTATATLSKTERELVLRGLLKAGLVVAGAGGLHLHPDVAATLAP